MRIVGGRFRGRRLAAPRAQAIRPTSDRLRESLFNILAHGYGDPLAEARVLDLFAGTGALGLEALSRGAAFALFHARCRASAKLPTPLRYSFHALHMMADRSNFFIMPSLSLAEKIK